MTFSSLLDFLRHSMRMQHIYQPLLIRTLVESGGTATLRQLAQAFVLQDESQLRHYEDRIKAMPLQVLKGHGVVEEHDGLVSLNVDALTYEQRAQIKALCEERLGEYVAKHGMGIWDYRAQVVGHESRVASQEPAKEEVAAGQAAEANSGFTHESEKEEQLFLGLTKNDRSWINDLIRMLRIVQQRDELSPRQVVLVGYMLNYLARLPLVTSGIDILLTKVAKRDDACDCYSIHFDGHEIFMEWYSAFNSAAEWEGNSKVILHLGKNGLRDISSEFDVYKWVEIMSELVKHDEIEFEDNCCDETIEWNEKCAETYWAQLAE